MRALIIMLLILGLSSVCMADNMRDAEKYSPGELAAIAVAAESLAIWGAYALGSDTQNSQRNVKVLVGVQLGWMLGLLMGPSETAPSKNLAFYVEPIGIGLNYNY